MGPANTCDVECGLTYPVMAIGWTDSFCLTEALRGMSGERVPLQLIGGMGVVESQLLAIDNVWVVLIISLTIPVQREFCADNDWNLTPNWLCRFN